MAKAKDRAQEQLQFPHSEPHVEDGAWSAPEAVQESAFKEAGYDETQPGQQEVVAGTVEHEQLLKSFPNATSYAPDVNVVVPLEPEEPPINETDPPPPEDTTQRWDEERG
jgi:hypothetical protein